MWGYEEEAGENAKLIKWAVAHRRIPKNPIASTAISNPIPRLSPAKGLENNRRCAINNNLAVKNDYRIYYKPQKTRSKYLLILPAIHQDYFAICTASSNLIERSFEAPSRPIVTP